MDSIFDLIEGLFSNFYIVIVIIAGIIGLFKSNTEKQKQEQRKTQTNPRPTATPSGANQRKPERVRATRAEQQQTISMKTIEEQQEEQMKRLAGKYNANAKQAVDTSHTAFKGENSLREPEKHTSENHNQLKKQMRNNLGRKGLINGIIMAEVIGSPRAKKPYRSVIDERRK